MYKSIESFKEQSSFTTWLYRITTNVCSDILRKRQKHSGVISINQAIDEKKDMDIRDESPTPEENMEISERQRSCTRGDKRTQRRIQNCNKHYAILRD